jgi:hypothetical protein
MSGGVCSRILVSTPFELADVKAGHFQLPKSVGEPAGLAELMVSYCENAAGFSNDVGCQNEGYFDALVHMFEQALKVTRQLSAADRDALIVRLDRVRSISQNLGYGVGDDMDSLLIDCTGT